jgi:two-component system cell cycle sensor histidine kinase PleC
MTAVAIAGAVLFGAVAAWGFSRIRRTKVRDRVPAEDTPNQPPSTSDALERRLNDTRAANDALAELLIALSAEMRVRLKAIVAFSDLIRQEMLGPVGNRNYADYAQTIYANSERLLAAVAEAQELSKAQAGEIVLANDTVDPRLLVRNAVSLADEEASQCGVRIVETYGRNLPLIRVDERRLRKVLLTVLNHAVAASHTGAEVHIEVQEDAAGITVAVLFPGVSAVAGEFADADGEETGSGIGMRLSRRLMTLHGGSLTVGSSAAAIRLPASRIVQAASKAASF